jgi:hypothetical protein
MLDTGQTLSIWPVAYEARCALFDLIRPDGELLLDNVERQPHFRDRLDLVFWDLGFFPDLK